MKLYVFVFVVLMLLVQAIFSQATLTQSLSDNNNLKRMSSAWGKRMSSAWGKRMSSAWGKRADSDNEDFYNQILRELYHQARLNKYEQSRYPIDDAVNPVILEQYLAQRTSSNNDEGAAPENMS